ncbi:hypothetical protein MHF_1313 [Mycoplasma haemofelis Ohio2]|uniref:Lipoprotein n=1 Tax=Mycoplasma haemofelis (strain Ohio2) TaxID=859194 RepID=F6FG51_MYCHI|nr:hypothetical protein MHF_1313 [Mycoplasma haemofelis Ohio2]
MKFGSAALVGGTTAAGMASAAAGYYAFSPSDKEERAISSLLSEDPSRRAIADNEDWSSAWSKYKASNKDVWDLKNSDANAPEVFKTACKNRLESKVSGKDSEGYRDFVSYCTRDTKVSDLIKDAGKTVLIKSGNEAQWKAAWERYRLAHQGSGTDPWTIDKFSENKSKADQPASEDFQNKCVERLDRASISDVELIDEVTKWCTVEGK